MRETTLNGLRIPLGTHATQWRKSSIVLMGLVLVAAAPVRTVCHYLKYFQEQSVKHLEFIDVNRTLTG